MTGRPWDADQLERTVRNLRDTRTHVEFLVRRLRERGWEDYQLEDLVQSNRLLAEVQLTLLSAADRMRHRELEGEEES